MSAAQGGHKEVVKILLEHEKETKNKDEDTALILAARAGHEDIVELLDPTDENGVTALMRAADRNDVEVVRALIPLHKGKTASCVTIDKCVILRGPALMMAAIYGHAEVVRLLVEHEGGMKDEDGWTALMYAARENKADCIKLLLEKEGGMQDNDGWTALMGATYNNNLE